MLNMKISSALIAGPDNRSDYQTGSKPQLDNRLLFPGHAAAKYPQLTQRSAHRRNPPFWIATAILTGRWARDISIVAEEALFTPSKRFFVQSGNQLGPTTMSERNWLSIGYCMDVLNS